MYQNDLEENWRTNKFRLRNIDRNQKDLFQIMGEYKMEIAKMLTLSTGHIAKSDNEYLANIEGLYESDILVMSHGYGWIINVGTGDKEYCPELTQLEAEVNLSEDFRNLFKLARSLNCQWLNLDADGPLEGFLPTHDW